MLQQTENRLEIKSHARTKLQPKAFHESVDFDITIPVYAL